MAEITKFKTDVGKEVEGVWAEFALGIQMKIASISNKRYEAYMREAGQPYRQRARAGTLEPEVQDRILKDGMSRFILLDWKGIDEDGKEVPYSQPKALEYLKDYQEVFDFVLTVASDASLYRHKDLEDARKNLPTGSWALRWGSWSEQLVKLRAKRYVKCLEETEEIYEDLSGVWEMWLELHAARQSNGFGPQTFTTANALAAFELWDVKSIEERHYCLSLLRSMDVAYLRWWSEEREAEDKDGSPSGSN